MNTQPDNQEAECMQVSEALSAHFDGAANNVEQQLATAHLAQCASCAQMWREWQSLRLMEQRALEPTASGEMLPLTPAKVPRHLKAAILRQTSSLPILQRFWPRLLTGMAVPTVAVACWLLVVAAPWQQSLPQIDAPTNPAHKNRLATIPDVPTALSETPEKSSAVVANTPQKATPIKTTPSLSVNENKPSRFSHQTKSRPVSVAPTSRIKPTSRVTATNSTKPSKSTFSGDTEPETKTPEPKIQLKPPQISMASLERPRSRTAEPAISHAVEPITTVASKPRVTEPVLLAEIPDHDSPNATEDTSNPVLEYIAANDVRPDDIRLAVENYRAALLDIGSDL